MGSYSSLQIGHSAIYAVKNDIDPLVMSLFRPHEKEIEQTTHGDYSPDDYADMADEPLTLVRYVSRAREMCERLDLMGFSLALTRTVFDRGRTRKHASWDASLREFGIDAGVERRFHRMFAALERMTLEDWMNGFRYIVELEESPDADDEERDALPFPVGYMLDHASAEFFGFPTSDTRVFLRAALQAVDRDEFVVQDLTDLVAGGWFDTASDLNQYADELVIADFATTQRIVVLTEGASDKRVIQAALRARRPHLADYFSFIDFEELKVQGGAASVINFVKGFAGAGIVNRVIAILDNDTAARAALRALRGITMPSSIRVVQLPQLTLLCEYPTVGPGGVTPIDVNGLAASVELYFGEDVLRRTDGSLTPVQWRGYDQALQAYQGEVLDKVDLHSKFDRKIERFAAGDEDTGDWTGIDAILDAVCGAFLNSMSADLIDAD